MTTGVTDVGRMLRHVDASFTSPHAGSAGE